MSVAVLAISLSSAQNPFNLDTTETGQAKAEIGGSTSIDMIRLRGASPGVPLRFGNVMPGSERVSLDGSPLVAGQDYSMDYEAGVVYLKKAQRPGMSVTVSYRYSKKASPTTSASKGFAGFKFDLMPGGLKAVMGLGLAERRTDGTVSTANIYGLNNSFSFGGGSKLSGLYLIGEKQKVNSRSAFEYQGAPQEDDSGASNFVLQNFASRVAGGEAYVDYQSISKNFTGFGQVADAGVAKNVVDALQKEKGLDRIGYGLRDMRLGGGKLSSNFRTVKDDGGTIAWKDFGFANGGLSLNYSSREVDQKFTRFKDIREDDRLQLQKEAGLSRETLGASFASKMGTLSYSENRITDTKADNGILRTSLKLDTSKIKFNLNTQEIDQKFTRTQSLFEGERGQWGRELGMKRQEMGLEAALLGKGVAPIEFKQNLISNKDGGFAATDVAIPGRGWSLSRVSRSVDEKFGGLGNLTQGEWDANIKSITTMYQADGLGFDPSERGRFLSSAGIGREVTRLTAQPFKSWKMNLERLELKGRDGSTTVDTYALAGKNFSANYRSQSMSDKFSEAARLMQFEQARLGVLPGLDKKDFGLNARLGGQKVFEYASMDSQLGSEAASRQRVRFTDKKFEFELIKRDVSSEFNAVGSLVDPEKDLLMQLRGFKQTEQKLKWEIAPSLKLDYQDYTASSDKLKQDRNLRQTSLSYNPNAKLSLGYSTYEYQNDDPLAILFSQKIQRFSFMKDLDKLGKVSYAQETQDFEGTQAQALADMKRTYMSYQKRVDPRTTLTAERTETRWENGEHENINANTVATQISTRAGVSVTDTKIDRKGDDRDETKRNYGVWYEVAKNVRLSWGYNRHLNGDATNTMSSTFTLSNANTVGIKPDQVGQPGSVQMGNLDLKGGYGVNRWDKEGGKDRTQAFSNVGISMLKPVKLGPVSDFTLNFGFDAAADQFNWLRENRVFNVGGKLGSNVFAYSYKGQMDPYGRRAVDRTMQFNTDMGERSRLRASVNYKVRTLPGGDSFMIRNYTLSAKPLRNLEISNQLLTNPEVARGDVLLGSLIQGANVNRWRMDWKNSPNFTVGGTWDQMHNEQSRAYSTTSGLNVTLFEKSGSPVQIFFGGEEMGGNVGRKYTHRYSIGFNQKAGPNQQFSFFLGNLSYLNGRPDDQKKNAVTMRLDYQVRF